MTSVMASKPPRALSDIVLAIAAQVADAYLAYLEGGQSPFLSITTRLQVGEVRAVVFDQDSLLFDDLKSYQRNRIPRDDNHYKTRIWTRSTDTL